MEILCTLVFLASRKDTARTFLQDLRAKRMEVVWYCIVSDVDNLCMLCRPI